MTRRSVRRRRGRLLALSAMLRGRRGGQQGFLPGGVLIPWDEEKDEADGELGPHPDGVVLLRDEIRRRAERDVTQLREPALHLLAPIGGGASLDLAVPPQGQ